MSSTAPSNNTFETRLVSSLSKVFPDEALMDVPYQQATALMNEVFSFQVVYKSAENLETLKVNIQSELTWLLSSREQVNQKLKLDLLKE